MMPSPPHSEADFRMKRLEVYGQQNESLRFPCSLLQSNIGEQNPDGSWKK